MSIKTVLFVCAQALLLQSISGQCIGAGLGAPWGAGLWGADTWGAGPWGVDTWGAGPCGLDTWGAGAWGVDTWGAGPWGLDTWGAGPWGAGPYGAGIYGAEAPAAAAASHGGALPVASASAIPPTGVSVASDNAYAGELAVRGALPFLGTVSLEGALPTCGAGAVAFGCGNGAVAMLSEDIGAAGIAGPLGYGIGPLGYDTPFAGPFGRAGCGCGAFL